MASRASKTANGHTEPANDSRAEEFKPEITPPIRTATDTLDRKGKRKAIEILSSSDEEDDDEMPLARKTQAHTNGDAQLKTQTHTNGDLQPKSILPPQYRTNGLPSIRPPPPSSVAAAIRSTSTAAISLPPLDSIIDLTADSSDEEDDADHWRNPPGQISNSSSASSLNFHLPGAGFSRAVSESTRPPLPLSTNNRPSFSSTTASALASTSTSAYASGSSTPLSFSAPAPTTRFGDAPRSGNGFDLRRESGSGSDYESTGVRRASFSHENGAEYNSARNTPNSDQNRQRSPLVPFPPRRELSPFRSSRDYLSANDILRHDRERERVRDNRSRLYNPRPTIPPPPPPRREPSPPSASASAYRSYLLSPSPPPSAPNPRDRLPPLSSSPPRQPETHRAKDAYPPAKSQLPPFRIPDRLPVLDYPSHLDVSGGANGTALTGGGHWSPGDGGLPRLPSFNAPTWTSRPNSFQPAASAGNGLGLGERRPMAADWMEEERYLDDEDEDDDY